MSRARIRGPRSDAGFYLIGVIITIAIVMILASSYFEQNKQGVSTYNASMDRTVEMDCLNNRNVIRYKIQRWSLANPGVPVTMRNLRNSGVDLPFCRAGGTYEIYNNELYCSIHYPVPTPEPTQTPLPAVDFFGERQDAQPEPTQTPLPAVDFFGERQDAQQDKPRNLR